MFVGSYGAMIKVLLLTTLLIAGNAFAQSDALRLELSAGFLSTHLDENQARLNGPELTGNSVSVPVRLEAQYSLRSCLHIPFWLDATAELPVVATAGDEVGKVTRDGVDYTVQTEHAEHRRSTIDASLGFGILPFLQPYLGFEYRQLSSRRTGQQNGQEDGSIQPDPNQDYTETVDATYLGVGVVSVIPLVENDASRLRLNATYLNAQGVSVSNTYFDDGSWGQHTSGYKLGGRLAFETALQSVSQDAYLTLGINAEQYHWNGDGHVGTDIFQRPMWPANSVTELGAFVGLGLFF